MRLRRGVQHTVILVNKLGAAEQMVVGNLWAWLRLRTHTQKKGSSSDNDCGKLGHCNGVDAMKQTAENFLAERMSKWCRYAVGLVVGFTT